MFESRLTYHIRLPGTDGGNLKFTYNDLNDEFSAIKQIK